MIISYRDKKRNRYIYRVSPFSLEISIGIFEDMYRLYNYEDELLVRLNTGKIFKDPNILFRYRSSNILYTYAPVVIIPEETGETMEQYITTQKKLTRLHNTTFITKLDNPVQAVAEESFKDKYMFGIILK